MELVLRVMDLRIRFRNRAERSVRGLRRVVDVTRLPRVLTNRHLRLDVAPTELSL